MKMNLLALSLCFTFTSQSNCTAEFPSEQEIKREQKAHKKEGVCRSVREVERDIEMRRGSRFGIHVFLFLGGCLVFSEVCAREEKSCSGVKDFYRHHWY